MLDLHKVVALTTVTVTPPPPLHPSPHAPQIYTDAITSCLIDPTSPTSHPISPQRLPVLRLHTFSMPLNYTLLLSECVCTGALACE